MVDISSYNCTNVNCTHWKNEKLEWIKNLLIVEFNDDFDQIIFFFRAVNYPVTVT